MVKLDVRYWGRLVMNDPPEMIKDEIEISLAWICYLALDQLSLEVLTQLSSLTIAASDDNPNVDFSSSVPQCMIRANAFLKSTALVQARPHSMQRNESFRWIDIVGESNETRNTLV